jgi:NAD(P)-dependent dehydrogenase (short-subunit alcohol dehydrogenase family)
MKALIIGGTSGFGKNVVAELQKKGFITVIVGRSDLGSMDTFGYVCDVGNLEDWQKTIEKIKKDHSDFDAIFFIAGYARAKNSECLTIKDWSEHFAKNVTYVALGLQNLGGLMINSENPLVVTIGSQWSYKIGNNELIPYIVSKHALNTLTQDFAVRNRAIRVNHYCVPTMDTPQYQEVQKSFVIIEKEFKVKELANPAVVAESLVKHCFEYKKTGGTLIMKDISFEEI